MSDFLRDAIERVRSAIAAAITHLDHQDQETGPLEPRWLDLQSLLGQLEAAQDDLEDLDAALAEMDAPSVDETDGALQLNDEGRAPRGNTNPSTGPEQAGPG